MFFNNLQPSVYGVDIARTARLYAAGMRGGALVSSAYVDRMLGPASIICMGLFALAFAPAKFENNLATGVFGLSLSMLLLVFLLAAVPRCARYLDNGFGERWPRLHSILECFPRYRDAPGLILVAFTLSVLNQLLVVGTIIAVVVIQICLNKQQLKDRNDIQNETEQVKSPFLGYVFAV